MVGTKRRLNIIKMSGKFIQILLIFMAYYYLIMGTSIERKTIDLIHMFSKGCTRSVSLEDDIQENLTRADEDNILNFGALSTSNSSQ